MKLPFCPLSTTQSDFFLGFPHNSVPFISCHVAVPHLFSLILSSFLRAFSLLAHSISLAQTFSPSPRSTHTPTHTPNQYMAMIVTPPHPPCKPLSPSFFVKPRNPTKFLRWALWLSSQNPANSDHHSSWNWYESLPLLIRFNLIAKSHPRVENRCWMKLGKLWPSLPSKSGWNDPNPKPHVTQVLWPKLFGQAFKAKAH